MSYPQLLTPEEKLADAKKLLSLPRIVVICGSTRFMTEMTEADLRETKAGKIVVKPGCDMKSPHELWSDPVEAEALKVTRIKAAEASAQARRIEANGEAEARQKLAECRMVAKLPKPMAPPGSVTLRSTTVASG